MKPGYGIGLKWLKALMLSPGVLFTFAYITIWHATNIYLDHAFRARLANAFSNVAGNRYRLTIGSIGTGPELSSLTMERLELVALAPASSGKPRRISIDRIDIACPDIGLILILPSRAEVTTRSVSKALLERYAEIRHSMNDEAGPAPTDRGDLAYGFGQQRHVRVP